jgi:hypothetical protein
MEQLGRPRSGACRVCLKSFKTEDFFRICCECTQKVCEDCASYSKNEEGLEEVRETRATILLQFPQYYGP